VEKHKVTIIEELEKKEGRIRKRNRKHKKKEGRIRKRKTKYKKRENYIYKKFKYFGKGEYIDALKKIFHGFRENKNKKCNY
jgi:hypothetical protein